MKTRVVYLLRKVGHVSVTIAWNLQMQPCATSPFLTLHTPSARSIHRILHNVLQYVLISESTILPPSNLITEITYNVEESGTPTITLIARKHIR